MVAVSALLAFLNIISIPLELLICGLPEGAATPHVSALLS